LVIFSATCFDREGLSSGLIKHLKKHTTTCAEMRSRFLNHVSYFVHVDSVMNWNLPWNKSS